MKRVAQLEAEAQRRQRPPTLSPQEPRTRAPGRAGSGRSTRSSGSRQSELRSENGTDNALHQMAQVLERINKRIDQKSDSEPKSKLPLRKIGKFSGKPEDAPVWLKQFKSGAEANGWSDRAKRSQVINYLEGSAQNWFEHQIDGQEVPYDWKRFEREFRKVFIDSIGMDPEARLYTLKKEKDQTVIEFANKLFLTARATGCQKTEEELIRILYNKIPMTFGSAIIDQTKIDSVLRILTKLEQMDGNYKSEREPFIPKKNPNKRQLD